MNLAHSFFSIASSDLQTAELLYRNGKFPSALYHLQQAVEKFTKAIGIKSGMLASDEGSIRKISHKSAKVFTRHLSANQAKLKNLNDLEKVFPGLGSLISPDEEGQSVSGFLREYNRTTKKVINLNPDDFAWPSVEDLNLLFSVIESTREPFDLDIKDFDAFYPEYFNNLIAVLTNSPAVTSKEIEDFKDSKEQLHSFSREVLISVTQVAPKINYLSASLFLFSLILVNHNESTRYPCLDCGETPEELYPVEAPLIQLFPQFSEILKITERYLQECYFANAAVLN